MVGNSSVGSSGMKLGLLLWRWTPHHKANMTVCGGEGIVLLVHQE